MAKDPNQSDNQSNPNEIGNSLSSRIEEIGRSAYSIPAEERELRRKAMVAREGIDIYEGLSSVQRQYEPIQKIHRQNVNTLSRTEPRIRIGVEARLERITQQAVNEIGRSFDEGKINRMVGELGGTSDVQQQSTMYASTNYTHLYTRSAQIHQELESLRGRATGAAGDLFTKRGLNPAAQSELQRVDRELQDKLKELAPINVAMRTQRQAGLDPQSRMERLFAKRQEAGGIIDAASRAEDVRGGRLGSLSMEQLKELEINKSKKLAEAFRELEDAAKRGATNLDDLQKKAEKTANNLEKTQEAIAGGGGRGRNDISYLSLAHAGFQAGAAAVQQITVNQRLDEVQNIAGFAGIENQKYQMYKSAAGGDVMSQLMLSQFAGAGQFGREVGFGAKLGVLGQQVAGYAQLGMGVAQLANPVQDIATTGEAGINNSIQGIATSTVADADVNRRVSESQAKIAAISAQMEARRQLLAVSGEQLQGFRDYTVGLGTAAIGMGAGGAGFLNRTITGANMGAMVNARISPEQFASMSQFGVQNLGSTFNERQIFAARNLERAGLGTMQENMQRMATLAQAGANNPQTGLSDVMAAAFTKGLDTSKVLNMVADHTGTLAERSAGMITGMDTTAAAAAIATASIDKNAPNKEYAATRARTVADYYGGLGTDIGSNFAAMSATARISQTMGVGTRDAIVLQKMDDTTLAALRNERDPNKVRSTFAELGVESLSTMKDDKALRGKVDSLVRARLITNLTGGATGLGMGTGRKEVAQIADRLMSGELTPDDLVSMSDKLTPGQRSTLMAGRRAGFTGGGVGGGEGVRQAVAILNTPSQQAIDRAKTAGTAPDKLISDQQRTLDDMRTQGFKQLSQAALEATQGFKSAAETLKALGNLSKVVETIGDKGGEGKFKGAAAEAAGTFGGSVTRFDTSVSDFTKAVNKLVGQSGISSGETVTNYDNLMHKLGLGPGT